MNLKPVVMPTELVNLLKKPMGDSIQEIATTLNSNAGISTVVEKCFKEYDEFDLGIEKAIQVLGWPHFRERLVSIYIYKRTYGSYPLKTDITLVDSICRFEAALEKISLHNNSRVFLLGTYLKFLGFEKGFEDTSEKLYEKSFLNIFKGRQARSDKTDWLILTSWHFLHFLGGQKFSKAIEDQQFYAHLFEQLSTDQKKQMMSNLLAYGCSINESDPFTRDKV